MCIGGGQGIAGTLHNLANVVREQGNYSSARSLYQESLVLRRELGDKRSIAVSLAALGALAATTGGEDSEQSRNGESERGVRLLGAASAWLPKDAILESEDKLNNEHGAALAREQLGQQAYERAWQEGQAMSLEEAITYAMAEHRTG